MTSDELREIQAPFKAKYKASPETAVIHSCVTGALLLDHPACRIDTLQGPVVAGMHPAVGGDGSEACSIDILLEALVGCAGLTFNLVATAMGIPFNDVKIKVHGASDIRGALGINKEVPVGVTHIRLHFEVDSPATDEQVALLIKQTERYCMVYQTLLQPPVIETSVSRMGV
jgi:uncharacterized OsmC-like protein